MTRDNLRDSHVTPSVIDQTLKTRSIWIFNEFDKKVGYSFDLFVLVSSQSGGRDHEPVTNQRRSEQ